MPRRLHKGYAFPFGYTALSRAPGIEHAVYLFWSNARNRCVYVGKTDRTLPERLREHWLRSDNPTLRAWIHCDIDDLEVTYVSCPASVVIKLERRIIRCLDPIGNIDHKT